MPIIVELTRPTRARKFGWAYSTAIERDSTRVIPPTAPIHTGTFASVRRKIEADNTFQAYRSGGTIYTTRWFYDGDPIVDQDAFLWQMHEIYDQRDRAKAGWGNHRPEFVTFHVED